MEGFEPATLSSRTRCAARLRYTPLKHGDLQGDRTPRKSVDSGFASPAASQAIILSVGVVRSVGVEPTWLPATLSRWCVYRFRHERGYWRTRWDSNPRSFRAGLRDRALCRSGHWSGMEDPGGFEPLEDGLKGRSLSIRV